MPSSLKSLDTGTPIVAEPGSVLTCAWPWVSVSSGESNTTAKPAALFGMNSVWHTRPLPSSRSLVVWVPEEAVTVVTWLQRPAQAGDGQASKPAAATPRTRCFIVLRPALVEQRRVHVPVVDHRDAFLEGQRGVVVGPGGRVRRRTRLVLHVRIDQDRQRVGIVDTGHARR